jgi:RNA polymerase sigma-70 factor (ECF subfamily)
VVEDFEDWYRLRHPRVIGAVHAACGEADVAAEATDEAFVRALDRWDRVRVMDSPDAWVTKVAINVMRRRMRRRSTEVRLLRDSMPPLASDRSDLVPDPEVWAAVRALPERQRLAVVLRYVGDLTEAEIGRVMGIARGTVAASLAAARIRLAEQLGGITNESPDQGPERKATHG